MPKDGECGIYEKACRDGTCSHRKTSMKFIIEIELELPVDEEGLTNEGWEIASNFQNAIDKLRDDYSWREITNVGMPKRKNS